MVKGLRRVGGAGAAPPYSKGPYTWDQELRFAAASAYTAPLLSVGNYGAGNAVIDTSVLDNIQFCVNVRTGTNKTSADTSCIGAYIGCGNTSDTIHAKLQALLVTNTVGFDCFDAYCVQGNMAITDTMATHAGNANLVAGAFKVSIKDTCTATGNVSALYLVTGDTDATTGDTATGQFDMLRFENNSTQIDNVISIGGMATADYLLKTDVGSDDASGAFVSTSSMGANATAYALKIRIGGTDGYIPVFDTKAWT